MGTCATLTHELEKVPDSTHPPVDLLVYRAQLEDAWFSRLGIIAHGTSRIIETGNDKNHESYGKRIVPALGYTTMHEVISTHLDSAIAGLRQGVIAYDDQVSASLLNNSGYLQVDRYTIAPEAILRAGALLRVDRYGSYFR